VTYHSLWLDQKDSTAAAVYEAIMLGYRHLDCACDYGNEVQVGEGVARAISEGLISREELFVTSKLWNTYHAQEHVPLACDRSLSDLGLDYLDLYLIHFPISLKFMPFEARYPPGWVHDPEAEKPCMEYAPVPMQETWGALEKLVGDGKVRNIGLCNVNSAGLRDVLSYAVIPPAVLQIERHVYLQQAKLVRLCGEWGVAVTGFSPLGSGSYVELGMADPKDSPLAEPAVLAAAERHGVSPAQVLLRWGVQSAAELGAQGSVIPKSSKPARLAENLQALVEPWGLELDKAEMAALAELDKHRRFNDPGEFTQGMNSYCPIFD